MAEFCGVQDSAIVRWLYHQDNLPKGETRIKLLCFLELNGYTVIEFERVTSRPRNFSRLIGYGLITSKKANEMLGFASVSQLFQVLSGRAGTSEDREQKLWDVWRAWKDRLDAKVEEAQATYHLNFSPAATRRVAAEQPIEAVGASIPSEDSASQGASAAACPCEGVIHIMHGLLKLLDSGVLKNPSDTDKAALRSQSGVVFRLSAHLSTISADILTP